MTHLRNNQTTHISVSFDATVEYGGVERTLPLEFLTYNRTFETDEREEVRFQATGDEQDLFMVYAFSEAEDADANTVGLDVNTES